MKNKFQKITLGFMLLISLFTFSQIAYAGGPDYEEPTEEITKNPMTEKEENPLTPDGNATLVDQASDKDGKEFYTFTSPAGNQFFLIIDKQRSDNNVYFLDYVTEKDLISLAKKDKENPLITEIPETKQPEPEIKEEKPEEKPVEEETSEKKQSNIGMFLILLLVTVGVGIVAYYFKILKPKQELDAADDFEEIEFLTEEDTENEEEFEDLDLDMEETSEFSEEEEL